MESAQTCGNNNCGTSEGATMMTQAKTRTHTHTNKHMKSQHDDGDDCDQSTNSTSKCKINNIRTNSNRMRDRRQAKSGNPTNERVVDKSNQKQSQGNLNATVE